MLGGECVVGQRFLNAVLHLFRRFLQTHFAQLLHDSLCLFTRCLPRFLGVNRLEHVCDVPHPSARGNCEHIPVEMHDAALILRFRKYFAHGLQHPKTLISDNQPHALQSPTFQPLEEALPAGFVLLHALLCAQNLTVSVFRNANCHQNRDVFVFTAPVPLQVDAIHIDVRIPACQRPLPPVLDIHICLLVQFADRGRRYPAAPKRLRDVLYTPHRYACQVHLDKRFLHAAFPAPVPLDDCRFEADSLQPRYMKRYLPGGRGQPTVIVPAAIPLSILAALIPCRLGQPVRLRFQQVIQRFFHAPAYKFPDFPLDYFLVQCYNFLGHGLRLLSNVCLATSFYQMTLTLSLVLGTVFNPPVLEFAQLIVPYHKTVSLISETLQIIRSQS